MPTTVPVPTKKKKKRAKSLSPAGYAASKKLREKQAAIHTEMLRLPIDDKGEARELSAEDRVKFDKMSADIFATQEMIDKLESADPGPDRTDDDRSRNNPGVGASNSAKGRLARCVGESDAEHNARLRRAKPDYTQAALDFIIHKGSGRGVSQRAIQADIDMSGGSLVMPEMLAQKVIKAVDNILWIERYASTVDVPNAASLGIPTLEQGVDNFDWTTEIGPILPDTGMRYGKRALTPTPIKKRILVSERFLRLAMDSSFLSNDDSNGTRGARNQVINRMAYALANTKDIAFFLGSGVGQPLGIFTASNRGIPTTRDVTTGSPTNFTYDGLVRAKYSLKVQYHNAAVWGFNKSGMSALLRLVDGNGRPILNFATIPTAPATLLGNELLLSENIPGTFVSGAYVGFFGDLSYYMIANSLKMTMAVADQLYLETGQIGFFVGAESDGAPVLPEAFCRMKCN